MYEPERSILVTDKAAFAGDYVAFVVAETRSQAKDAAELIEVDYEELPPVVEIADAVAPDAPVIWSDCPDNVCFHWDQGDRAATDAAFAAAHHISKVDIPYARVAINPMEPRAAIGEYDPFEERYTLTAGNQFPHDIRSWLAGSVLKVPESKLRIISPDMGGSFGLRSTCFPELALVVWAAKEIGRPIKWVNERSEGILEEHARDFTATVELALDAEGTFLGLRLKKWASVGAYLHIFGPLPAFGNLGGLAGVYRTPAIHAEVTGVFTNSAPTSPYRGAGRPEATLAIEQAIDRAAQEMGIDRIELRRRNIIPPDAFPYQTALNYNYDCGEFERNMDRETPRDGPCQRDRAGGRHVR
jgi:carbon-monoxide dehydrogenase large subunit